MMKQRKMKSIFIICFSFLLVGCGVNLNNDGSDVNSNIDYSYADKEQLQYPTLIRASKEPIDVVYAQKSALGEDVSYQYYYLYETENQVVGSVAIDFETVNIKEYGVPGDILVYRDEDRYYLNIWTGPGENRNYLYDTEHRTLQQLAYGDLQLTAKYLYIQGIVLAVDGGAPLHIYTKAGEHVCKVSDNSTEYKIIDSNLYYIENEVVEDESGSYKLRSIIRRTTLTGEDDQQVGEIIADTIPDIRDGYITYENDGNIYSMELEEQSRE